MEKNLKEVINEIITATFNRLNSVYKEHKEGKCSGISPSEENSRLVFPMYGPHRGNETRISEQELRFAFVEEFYNYCNENNCNLFYSVETPTRDKYSGSSNNDKGKDPQTNPNGRSGEFDLVIFNEKMERVCLIEFKANNSRYTQHKKDFIKLNNKEEGDASVLRFFIEIVKNYDDDTIKNLKEKLENNQEIKAEFRCYSLENGEEITQSILEFKNKSLSPNSKKIKN